MHKCHYDASIESCIAKFIVELATCAAKENEPMCPQKPAKIIKKNKSKISCLEMKPRQLVSTGIIGQGY